MTGRVALGAVILCGVLSSANAAVAADRQRGAAPPRDGATASPAGTAKLAGKVLDEASNAALGGAVVTLSGGNLKRARSAVTDIDGHFVFADLPEGRFTLTGSKTAYVTMAYGAKAFGRQGTAIVLAAAQDLRDVTLRLPRGAVITGTVRDENGAPIPEATVAANRSAVGSSRPPSAVTDDRGVYRLFALMPGSYLVSAVVPTTGLGDVTMPSVGEVDRMLAELQRSSAGSAQPPVAAASASPAPRPNTSNFVPIFYPGTTDAGQAETVTLAPSEERTMDFVLRPSRTCTIEGVVRTADASPVPPISLGLSSPNPAPAVVSLGMSAQVTSHAGTGTFVFNGVTPGNYVIRVRSSQGRASAAPTDLLWADQAITVSGESISGITLVLQPGLHFTGKLVFDGAGSPPVDPTKVTVTLGAPLSLLVPGGYVSPAANAVISGNAAADGSFEIHNIVPGSYLVGATTASSWRLVSAIVNGRDAADTPLEFAASDLAGATLRFVDRHVTLSGTLETAEHAPAAGYTVVVLPADRSLWRARSRRIQSTRPASDGKYTFTDLPAGEYLIAALTDVTPDDLSDLTFLESVTASAIKVILHDDADTVENLRIK